MKEAAEFYCREEEYPELDREGAVRRLSEAVKCVTVNYADHSRTDFGEFGKLQELMRRSYPCLMEKGSFETIGHSVLITVPGTDASLRPCLYMSHQDVVPVVEGTEKDWSYGAFSGAVEEGYIWGRGTLDIKNQVFGVLEAAEYLLSHGAAFRRTAYLAFGEDEETTNEGALALARELQRRGVTLEFLLDEGGGSVGSGASFGAPEIAVSEIRLMEKGYADLELSAESRGGHSSRPFGGTSLEHLACAIADITRHPFPTALPTALRETFRTLAPSITEEPLRTLCRDVDGNAQAIADYCRTVPALFPYVTTTIAPTMIRGSSAACNVMPQNMAAVINFRLSEQDSVESVFRHCRESVKDETVKMRYLQANNASAVARIDGLGYALLKKAMEHFYPEVRFIPSITAGATDAHQYESICDTCLRCTPFLSDEEETRRGVHGTNERIAVRTYLQGIRVLIRLMEKANL